MSDYHNSFFVFYCKTITDCSYKTIWRLCSCCVVSITVNWSCYYLWGRRSICYRFIGKKEYKCLIQTITTTSSSPNPHPRAICHQTTRPRRQPRLVQRKLPKRKMEALGLPSFDIVQNNISFNDKSWRYFAAYTPNRGISSSPLPTAVFGAWCDLRKGDSFGRVFTHEIDPGTAIFVPKGVANG